MSTTYHIDKHAIAQDIQDIMQDVTVITPDTSTMEILIQLLQQKKIATGYIFDLYLAATMITNGLTHIITANEKDFTGIPGIMVYNPWSTKK